MASLDHYPVGRALAPACSISRQNRRRRLLTLFPSLVLPVVLGFGLAPVSAESATTGQIITVEASSAANAMTLGGTVVAYKQVMLTAQIPGRVDFIAGVEGDAFKADDILVAIDDDDLLAKRRAAIAQLNNAGSQIANAQVQYNREMISPQSRSITRSGGMGLPSMMDQMFTQPFAQMMPGDYGGDHYVDRQADLYRSGTQLTQAQNHRLTSQSHLDEIDAKLRDTRSFAPFTGVIVHKLVEQGDTVQPGQPLIEFADLTYLQVRVDVPVRLVSGLEKGMLVPVKIDVGNVRVDARVAQIFPTADAVRHTVIVKFDLPTNIPGGPGMYAEVMIPDVSTDVSNVPVIPDSAVLWRGSLPAIYVATADNRKELRLIRLGDYVSGNQVSVLSGLSVGDRIYVTPPADTSSDWSKRSK